MYIHVKVIHKMARNLKFDYRIRSRLRNDGRIIVDIILWCIINVLDVHLYNLQTKSIRLTNDLAVVAIVPKRLEFLPAFPAFFPNHGGFRFTWNTN